MQHVQKINTIKLFQLLISCKKVVFCTGCINNYCATFQNLTLFLSLRGCGERLEGTYGVITSPGYPNAFAKPRRCSWSIFAPAGRKIKLTFNALNLPYDENLDNCLSSVIVSINY
jgi:hypothetical protein